MTLFDFLDKHPDFLSDVIIASMPLTLIVVFGIIALKR